MKPAYPIFGILFAILFTSCATTKDFPTHLVSSLIENPEAHDGEDVYLVICQEKNTLGAIHIFPCDGIHHRKKHYIDAVGSSEIEEALGRRQRLYIKGKFRAYSGSLVGGGFLTSKIGLLEIYSVGSNEP